MPEHCAPLITVKPPALSHRPSCWGFYLWAWLIRLKLLLIQDFQKPATLFWNQIPLTSGHAKDDLAGRRRPRKDGYWLARLLRCRGLFLSKLNLWNRALHRSSAWAHLHTVLWDRWWYSLNTTRLSQTPSETILPVNTRGLLRLSKSVPF